MPDQLTLPFAIAKEALAEFLDRYYAAFEDEINRLKEEQRQCKALYQDALPMRAVLTALKVVRAWHTLEAHVKESLSLPHQAYLEGIVMAHFEAQVAATARGIEDLTAE